MATLTWSQLMDKFHANDNSRIKYTDLLDVNELSKQLEITKGKFWQQLVNYLANEGETGYLAQTYFRKKDFPSPSSGDDSLLKYIKDNIDFPDNFNDSIMAAYKNKTVPSNTYYWNESTNDLIKYILNSFDFYYNPDSTDIDTIKVDDENSFSINNIKNANAGNSFELDEHWVESWTNAQGVSYAEVRGIDIEPTAITNSSYLNFTSNGTTGIRLLLPEYKRNVEIEDLNRNFWVIGQTLAGISAYLFSEDSPFTNSFEGIIKEIIDLWENILYLWLAFAISIQEKDYYTEVHEEVVYLSANDFQTEFKYDGFESSGLDLSLVYNNNDYDDIISAIQGKIEYLKAKYPHCHLCIIPVIRADNYEHNYYSTEFYPGAFLYDRNAAVPAWNFVSFKCTGANGIVTLLSSKYTSPATSISCPTAVGFTYNRKNDLYCSTFSETKIHNASVNLESGYDNIVDSTSSPKKFNYFGAEGTSMTFYGVVRAIPVIRNNHFYTYNNNELKFNRFDLNFYAPTKSGNDLTMTNFLTISWIRNGDTINFEKSSSLITNETYHTVVKTTSSGVPNNWPFYGLTGTTVVSESSLQLPNVDKITGNKGFYMGELMSKNIGFFEEIQEN